jgi:putative DNA primase/helicase
MDRAADFKIVEHSGRVRIKPPSLDVVRDLAALASWGFPILEALVEIPVLRPNGTVLDIPGYDPPTRLYYIPPTGLDVPAIPECPTEQDAVAALKVV